MNKKIWTTLGAIVFLAATALPALAATEDTVSATVTPQLVSLTMTSDGNVAYGTLTSDTSEDTTASGLIDTQTVQNNGNVNEDFDIRSSNAVSAGTNWNLEATTNTDQYVHKFSTNGGSTYTDFPADNSVATLANGVVANNSQSFDLEITTPTESTNTDVHTITVTVVASAT